MLNACATMQYLVNFLRLSILSSALPFPGHETVVKLYWLLAVLSLLQKANLYYIQSHNLNFLSLDHFPVSNVVSEQLSMPGVHWRRAPRDLELRGGARLDHHILWTMARLFVARAHLQLVARLAYAQLVLGGHLDHVVGVRLQVAQRRRRLAAVHHVLVHLRVHACTSNAIIIIFCEVRQPRCARTVRRLHTHTILDVICIKHKHN